MNDTALRLDEEEVAALAAIAAGLSRSTIAIDVHVSFFSEPGPTISGVITNFFVIIPDIWSCRGNYSVTQMLVMAMDEDASILLTLGLLGLDTDLSTFLASIDNTRASQMVTGHEVRFSVVGDPTGLLTGEVHEDDRTWLIYDPTAHTFV